MLLRTRAGTGSNGVTSIAAGPVKLTGALDLPIGARGVVLVSIDVCGSAEPWSTVWMQELRGRELAVLCFGFLTPCERPGHEQSGYLGFDIPFLRKRWLAATRWALAQSPLQRLPLGYLASGAVAAAALSSAARAPAVRAVVCADGRLEFAGPDLEVVRAPTLLILSRNDHAAAANHERALARLGKSTSRLAVANDVASEGMSLARSAARLAAVWFERHLGSSPESI